jgi:hypothetical protein
MALDIEHLFGCKAADLFDVLAVHDELAYVVDERRLLHKETVVSRKVEMLSDCISDRCDAEAVGMGIPFELVHLGRKLEQLFIKTRFSRMGALHS